VSRRWAAAAATALAVAALVGCQSSQDKNAELAAHAKNAIKSEQGLTIQGQNKSVKVVGSKILTDKNGSAVVVTLKNEGTQTLVDAPIAIQLKSAKGKLSYTNTTPGLEKALHAVPLLPAGQEVDWVNDQVFASYPPKTVKVQVGNTSGPETADPSQLKVSTPKIVNDPVSGIEATGTITNASSSEADQVLLMAVARNGGQIVAAGRGGVKRVRPTGEKPARYHIFFIGNPKGATVTVEAYPNELG
jgi:hypothetical protein